MAVALVLALPALFLALSLALALGRRGGGAVVGMVGTTVRGRTRFALAIAREARAVAAVRLVERALECMELGGAGLDTHALGDHAPALAAVIAVVAHHVHAWTVE